MLKRAGIDPVRIDPRPLTEIMNDFIPFKRWEREKAIIKRAGYETWQDWLTAKRQK